ncbi:MAG: ornithine cyclodeaminase family protein, partial [Deltaproteobacteria bacterium]|nr:ornithine cyclodeaminase family protein [Deltaproteobacteria bacterium]
MPSTVLVLNNEQMEGLISMREAIDAMEIAYRELGEGVARLIPRHRIQLPKKTQPGVDYWFNNIPAAVPAFNTMALRIDSAGVRVREVAGMVRKDFPGDYVGLVLLFDIETNALTAMLFDHYLSPIRVAATSALVAKYLARQQASVVGLFGTGEQARAHAEAFCEIRKVKRIKVYSPTRANREGFAREMTGRLDVQVQAVDDPRAVVEGVEIVIAATNSNEPVFKGEWLEPGTHVVTIRGSDRHVK